MMIFRNKAEIIKKRSPFYPSHIGGVRTLILLGQIHSLAGDHTTCKNAEEVPRINLGLIQFIGGQLDPGRET